MSGSDISWAICKPAPHSRQIAMPAPHQSVFYRVDALPAVQQIASKHWRQAVKTTKQQMLPKTWPQNHNNKNNRPSRGRMWCRKSWVTEPTECISPWHPPLISRLVSCAPAISKPEVIDCVSGEDNVISCVRSYVHFHPSFWTVDPRPRFLHVYGSWP